MSAADLVALGTAIRVVPADTLDDEVEALADMLAGRDQQLLRHMKLAMNQVEPMQPLEAYTFEQMHTAIHQPRLRRRRRSPLQPDHVRDLARRAGGGPTGRRRDGPPPPDG